MATDDANARNEAPWCRLKPIVNSRGSSCLDVMTLLQSPSEVGPSCRHAVPPSLEPGFDSVERLTMSASMVFACGAMGLGAAGACSDGSAATRGGAGATREQTTGPKSRNPNEATIPHLAP